MAWVLRPIVIAICLVPCCLGLELTLIRDPTTVPGGRTFCGVLTCEANTVSTKPAANAQSGSDSIFKSITKMSIFKTFSADDSKSKREFLVAAVTSEQPSLTKVGNGMQINGLLKEGAASLQMELVKDGDCQAEYACEVQGMDIHGREAVSSASLVQQQQPCQRLGGSQLDDGSSLMPDVTSQLLASIQQLLNQSVTDLSDKMKELEHSIEDKIGDKLRSIEGGLESTIQDKLASVESSLADNIVSAQSSLEVKIGEMLLSVQNSSDIKIVNKMESVRQTLEDTIEDKIVSLQSALEYETVEKLQSIQNASDIKIGRKLEDVRLAVEQNLGDEIVSIKTYLENNLGDKIVSMENSLKDEIADKLISIESNLTTKIVATENSLKDTLDVKLMSVQSKLASEMVYVERNLEDKIGTKMVNIQNSSDEKIENKIISVQSTLGDKITDQIESTGNQLEKEIGVMLVSVKSNIEDKIASTERSLEGKIGENIMSVQNKSNEKIEDKITSIQSTLEDKIGDKIVSIESRFERKIAETILFIETSLEHSLEQRITELRSDFVNQIDSLKARFQDRFALSENRIGGKIDSNVNLNKIPQIEARVLTELARLRSEARTDLLARLDTLWQDLQDAQVQVSKNVSEFLEEALHKTSSSLLSTIEEDFTTVKSYGEKNLLGLRNQTETVQEALASGQHLLHRLWNYTLDSHNGVMVNFRELESNIHKGTIELQSEITDALTDSAVRSSDTFKSVLTEFLTPKLCRKGMGLASPHLLDQYIVLAPDGQNTTAPRDLDFPHLCDTVTDSGGWVVIQRRTTGHTDFDRTWDEYKQGFGSLLEDFWLGNDKLHAITASGSYELRVDLAYNGRTAFARYDDFSVADESENYKLNIGAYHGTAGDSLTYHNGREFTTMYRDNDDSFSNCAFHHGGGWWFGDCGEANLNGHWQGTDSKEMEWHTFARGNSVAFSEMKIRRM